jgi:hypothetical protein
MPSGEKFCTPLPGNDVDAGTRALIGHTLCHVIDALAFRHTHHFHRPIHQALRSAKTVKVLCRILERWAETLRRRHATQALLIGLHLIRHLPSATLRFKDTQCLTAHFRRNFCRLRCTRTLSASGCRVLRRAEWIPIHRTLFIYIATNGCSKGGIIRSITAPRALLRCVAGNGGVSAGKVVLESLPE